MFAETRCRVKRYVSQHQMNLLLNHPSATRFTPAYRVILKIERLGANFDLALVGGLLAFHCMRISIDGDILERLRSGRQVAQSYMEMDNLLGAIRGMMGIPYATSKLLQMVQQRMN